MLFLCVNVRARRFVGFRTGNGGWTFFWCLFVIGLVYSYMFVRLHFLSHVLIKIFK